MKLTRSAALAAALLFGCGSGKNDFEEPILADGATAEDLKLFTTLPTTPAETGPKIIEPTEGSLWPKNWAPPTFVWTKGTTTTGEEIDRWYLVVVVPDQKSDLRVCTGKNEWTPPQTVWDAVRATESGKEMQIDIYGAKTGSTDGGVFLGKLRPKVQIAPVEVSGSLVYWTTTNERLMQMKVGESTPSVFYGREKSGACVGCHAAAPDGTIGVTVNRGPWGIDLVDTSGNRAGTSLISEMLATTFGSSDRGTPAFSAAYWKSGDHRMMFGKSGEIGVVKLEGAMESVLPRTGDNRRAALPAWSADGTKVVYVSTDQVVDNRTDSGQTDLWTVPYNDGAGGAAAAIPGASSAEFHEYYPDISTDGKLVIFTRAPANVTTYNQSEAEIFVIPTAGGTATRLVANDPSPAEDKKSPGVTNSWAKWAPATVDVDGATWYFVTFSSTRWNDVAQVYVAPISLKGEAITTYPAIRLPGQDPATSNHTPAWVKGASAN